MSTKMEDQGASRKRPMILAGLAAAVALVLGGIVLLNPSSASGFATVTPLEASVSLQGPDEDSFSPIRSAVSADEGTKIKTDETGFAEVEFFDGSLTRLGALTEYELTTLQDGTDAAIVGDLELGRTFHRVVQLSGSGDKFEVRTSNAVAAVRGTMFTVVCEVRDVCVIGVVEGVVDVTSRLTGVVITLRAGEEVTVFADGSFSDVRPLDLTDPWLILNLELEGSDPDKLREGLFGPDGEPDTGDEPAPVRAGSASRSNGRGPTPPGPEGDGPPGAEGDGPPGDDVLGETVDRPGGPDGPPGPDGDGPPGPDGDGPPPCETGYPPRPC